MLENRTHQVDFGSSNNHVSGEGVPLGDDALVNCTGNELVGP